MNAAHIQNPHGVRPWAQGIHSSSTRAVPAAASAVHVVFCIIIWAVVCCGDLLHARWSVAVVFSMCGGLLWSFANSHVKDHSKRPSVMQKTTAKDHQVCKRPPAAAKRPPL